MKKSSIITNPVYQDLKDNKLVFNKDIITISNKTRDSKIAVLKDKKTKVIFLKKFSTGNKYYKKVKSHDKRSIIEKSKKRINKVSTSKGNIITPYLEDDIRRAKKYKKIFQKREILDYGCGWGNFLSLLKNNSSKCGVEIGDEFIKFINSKYKSIKIKKNINDFTEKFDYITLFHVLHYLPNQIEILKILRSKLKKNGKIIIEVPNANDFLLQFDNFDNFKNFTFCKEQLILHTEQSLKGFLKKAGFKNIKIEHYQRYNINNHLGWFVNNKPGGHKYFQKVFDYSMITNYSNFLKKLKMTDTLIVVAKK
tara:strand:+ start:1728 stop:2654 length:927 start_codon:yes stop_codon:yes gene_type:complete